MRGFRITAGIVALTSLLSNATLAADFTPTMKTVDTLKWLDLDSITASDDTKSVYEYLVYTQDQTYSENSTDVPIKYTVLGTKMIFYCSSEHYSAVNLYLYNDDGELVKSYEGSVDPPTIVSPQTAISEEYEIVCKGKKAMSFKDIPADQTPLQFLIGASRKILEEVH